jgi:hypothetical protein
LLIRIGNTQQPIANYRVLAVAIIFLANQANPVGAVLPDSGITYYDVPADYDVTGYRYTYVNDHAVLVDPQTRRVVQIID